MATNKAYKRVNILEEENLKKKIKSFKSSNKNFHRINLHKSQSDIIQVMVMMYKKNFEYTFHYSINKSETFSVIYGKFAIYFKNKKKIILDKNNNFLYKLNSNLFHKIVPITKIAVAIEILEGPYKKGMVKTCVSKKYK